MKTWMVTYINNFGEFKKIWFRKKTLIHACYTARKIMKNFPEGCKWEILDVERRR